MHRRGRYESIGHRGRFFEVAIQGIATNIAVLTRVFFKIEYPYLVSITINCQGSNIVGLVLQKLCREKIAPIWPILQQGPLAKRIPTIRDLHNTRLTNTFKSG
jgi:hypothetical protein